MFLRKAFAAQHKQRLTTTTPLLTSTALRCFGGGHEIVKADGDHKFIQACDKKRVVFDGLRPTANYVQTLNNQFRH